MNIEDKRLQGIIDKTEDIHRLLISGPGGTAVACCCLGDICSLYSCQHGTVIEHEFSSNEVSALHELMRYLEERECITMLELSSAIDLAVSTTPHAVWDYWTLEEDGERLPENEGFAVRNGFPPTVMQNSSASKY